MTEDVQHDRWSTCRGHVCPAARPPRSASTPGSQRPSLRRRYRTGADRGSVTAEAAVVLPVLLVVLALGVWVLTAVSAQMRCTDAAAVGARAAARGDASAEVVQAARRVAPEGAEVDVRPDAELVEVRVRAVVRPFGGVLARLPAVTVSGRSVAAREDQVGRS